MSKEKLDKHANEEITQELSEQELESVSGGIVGRPRHQGLWVNSSDNENFKTPPPN